MGGGDLRDVTGVARPAAEGGSRLRSVTVSSSSDAASDQPQERWLFGRYDYPVSHRVLELASLTAFVVLAALVLVRVGRALADGVSGGQAAAMAAGGVLALMVGDLASGIVHFLFDQFGSPETPVIGQKFVKPFRDHHDDPVAMTKGDFIAVNSDNLLVSLPVLVLALTVVDVRRHPAVGVFVVVLVAVVAMTNQIHKWSHTPTVPSAVAFAQRHGLILTIPHHDGHHSAPYDRHYCIALGRMDWLLDPITSRIKPAPH